MKYLSLLILINLFIITINAQEEEAEVEIFLIESYVPQENQNIFNISFITSEECKSKLIIAGEYKFDISNTLTENHKAQINLFGLTFDSANVPFEIKVTDSLGREYTSEQYEFALYSLNRSAVGSADMFSCLLGGAFFLTPSGVYIPGDPHRWGLTKEIPIVSFFTKGYRYPNSYISAEYQHTFEGIDNKNILRAGYKHLLQVPVFEYLSAGLTAYTNFKGNNGFSPEISLGLIKFYNVFTIYARYRYTINPSNSDKNFQGVSLGLYSSFFSLYY